MTIDDALHLYALCVALALGCFLRYAATHPNSRISIGLGRWLSSWWMRAPWSGDTAERLNRLAWVSFIVALVLFGMFFVDIPLRSRRLDF